MSELIIRCDDFGLTQGCSLGILRAAENKCISSVGVIVNTGVREDDASALAGLKEISIGLHMNIVAGAPLADIADVPGLVDREGNFYTSRRYRMATSDLIDTDEVETEAVAQVEAFRKLMGRDPAYIDCHSVSTPNLDSGLQRAADRFGIPYVDIRFETLGGGSELHIPTLPCNLDYVSYDPLSFVMGESSGILSHNRTILVFHPGFLDWRLFEVSTLRESRMKDQAALSSPEFRKWLIEHEVELIPIGSETRKR